MNFVMNHAPGAGSIAQPVDQQSSVLPLCYGRLLLRRKQPLEVVAIFEHIQESKYSVLSMHTVS